MKRSDVVALVAYATQLQPAQQFDEYTADAWFDVLGDLKADASQARQATAAVAKTERWIYPSAIRAELETLLRNANPPERAAILATPPLAAEERAAAVRRGRAACDAAIAAANPYRLDREDAPDIPENLLKARAVAVEHRAGQNRRDNAMKLGAAGGEVLSQINQARRNNR
jgi:hypothetical protein